MRWPGSPVAAARRRVRSGAGRRAGFCRRGVRHRETPEKWYKKTSPPLAETHPCGIPLALTQKRDRGGSPKKCGAPGVPADLVQGAPAGRHRHAFPEQRPRRPIPRRRRPGPRAARRPCERRTGWRGGVTRQAGRSSNRYFAHPAWSFTLWPGSPTDAPIYLLVPGM